MTVGLDIREHFDLDDPRRSVGNGPGSKTTTDFYSRLKQTGWAVNKLVGVHGRVTTVNELAKSVESAAGTVAASN